MRRHCSFTIYSVRRESWEGALLYIGGSATAEVLYIYEAQECNNEWRGDLDSVLVTDARGSRKVPSSLCTTS